MGAHIRWIIHVRGISRRECSLALGEICHSWRTATFQCTKKTCMRVRLKCNVTATLIYCVDLNCSHEKNNALVQSFRLSSRADTESFASSSSSNSKRTSSEFTSGNLKRVRYRPDNVSSFRLFIPRSLGCACRIWRGPSVVSSRARVDLPTLVFARARTRAWTCPTLLFARARARARMDLPHSAHTSVRPCSRACEHSFYLQF